MHTKPRTRIIRTTIGELAAAFYEVALEELKDEQRAAELAHQLVQQVLLDRRGGR